MRAFQGALYGALIEGGTETGRGGRAAACGRKRMALLLRCYFVKDAKIVAAKELPGVSCDEAVGAARAMFEEHASSYDGVEVWSLTRRIFRLGYVARAHRLRGATPPRRLGLEVECGRRSGSGRTGSAAARQAQADPRQSTSAIGRFRSRLTRSLWDDGASFRQRRRGSRPDSVSLASTPLRLGES
jgi:hypothetical protein